LHSPDSSNSGYWRKRFSRGQRLTSWGHPHGRRPHSRPFEVDPRSCPGTVSDLPVPGPVESRTPLLPRAGCIATGKLNDSYLVPSRIEPPLLGRQSCGGLLGGNSFGGNFSLRPVAVNGRNMNNAHHAHSCRAISERSIIDWAPHFLDSCDRSTVMAGGLI
jgi:hypothetical protein